MSETSTTESVAQFIARWRASGGAERANYALFLSELCDALGVPRPDPTRPDDHDNVYVFERSVTFDHGDGTSSTGRIDLYKRGCFVLEAKQGSAAREEPGLFGAAPASRRGTAVRGTEGWDLAMQKARGQAEQYVRALPSTEGNPPFIVVVDVGHSIELYADFSRLGKTYTPFPDPLSHRIKLEDLARDDIRDRLVYVWTDPLSLDPARHSAKVTRQIAEKLARLAKSFESAGHDPHDVANFLMRCLFTFFAEDVRLIDRDSNSPEEQPFTDLLKSLRGHLDRFVPMVQDVWARMDAGGFSTAIRKKLKHFNGKLFKECHALPVNDQQLELLIEAGDSDWSDVEPAIFGTLLERALDERERHKLGAHYTPRAYVERLVLPTVIEPLREEFEAAQAAAVTLNLQGKPDEARKTISDFLLKLCNTFVLDPACGSGNFLYVTMEHMKRLEGEARDFLRQLGEKQELLERAGRTVDPHQFLGLEINPRAVAIAELVLWIGYLKWHLRTLGHAPNEPLLRDFHNITEQDAVLAYDKKELVVDDHGKPVTRWDGHTMKLSPVTGEEIPDESARTPVYRYVNPRKAEWPKADYVVGNPPFAGNKRMRLLLGDGYVEALRAAYEDVPESSDFVMYWWHNAASLAQGNEIKRFGLITTNSITQSFNRRIVERHLADTHFGLAFAIPDHPWVESSDGASVRVAMTVGARQAPPGLLIQVSQKQSGGDDEDGKVTETRGRINAQLSVGVDLTSLKTLQANEGLACPGVQLSGQGFVVEPTELAQFGASTIKALIRPYLTGRDLTQQCRELYVIDAFGLSENDLRSRFPDAYQWLLNRVKPERAQNPREKYREEWWLHSEPRRRFRRALQGLKRFAATSRTARHRVFQFLDAKSLPETKVLIVAVDDGFDLGILSSRGHVLFATRTGGWLGEGNDPTYNHSVSFDSFPFPACSESQKQKIRELGEALDAHRKRQQAAHPGLTVTDMYNVLEKLRKGEALSAKEKTIHEQGLVSVLKQIHDDLDAAVAEAYGWPVNLSDEQILQRLVALNHERAEEEKRGVIRWLRPEFQNPSGAKTVQESLNLPAAKKPAKTKEKKQTWPKTLPEQARLVRAALTASAKPVSAEELAKLFKSARVDKITELLETLTSLGQARQPERGRFVA